MGFIRFRGFNMYYIHCRYTHIYMYTHIASPCACIHTYIHIHTYTIYTYTRSYIVMCKHEQHIYSYRSMQCTFTITMT